MRVFTAAQMKQAEADAVARGTSYGQLMENAGEAAAHRILQLAEKQNLATEITILTGRGNNAGDGFVVARLLAEAGWRVEVCQLADGPLSELADKNFHRLPAAVRLTQPENACFMAAVLCDAVFGTGFHGALPEAVAGALQTANAAEGLRVALDVPSGMNCDTGACDERTFCADTTLTFGAYKPALLMPELSARYGEVVCLDIGL